MVFAKGVPMLVIVADNLKLVLLFFMIVAIIAPSWSGKERWLTASRSNRQYRAGMRGRKARLSDRQRNLRSRVRPLV
jgi:hypothetical protein